MIHNLWYINATLAMSPPYLFILSMMPRNVRTHLTIPLELNNTQRLHQFWEGNLYFKLKFFLLLDTLRRKVIGVLGKRRQTCHIFNVRYTICASNRFDVVWKTQIMSCGWTTPSTNGLASCKSFLVKSTTIMVPFPTWNLGFQKHSKQHPYFANFSVNLTLQHSRVDAWNVCRMETWKSKV